MLRRLHDSLIVLDASVAGTATTSQRRPRTRTPLSPARCAGSTMPD